VESNRDELEREFASSADALLRCDPAGRIVDASPSACALTGYPREDLLARTLADLTEQGTGPLLLELTRSAALALEAGFRCKDGSTQRVHLRAHPVRMGDDTHSMIRVSRRRRACDQLPEDPEFVQVLLRAPGTYLVSVSMQGHVVFANAAFETLAGQPFSRLRGRRVWDLLVDPVHQGILRRATETAEASPDFTLSWPTPGGEPIPIAWSQALLTWSRSRPSYRILIGREPARPSRSPSDPAAPAVQPHDLERRIARVNADLEVLRLEHDSLMYTLSHDLRAPLRAMSGFSEALIEDYSLRPLDPAGQTLLRRISDSARRMDTLINGLLQYSRVCRMPVRPETVALDAVLSDIVRGFDREIRASGACVALEASPREIFTDRTVLVLMVSHLLSNALTFVRPQVVPRITLRAGVLDGERGIRISVCDNGIGIPAEYHRIIFGMFERLNRSESYLGTGMGLAIVGKCAERLNGSLGLESVLNEGSTFWVDLPLLL
jgi:PAS domain S-box-containing protein